MVDHQGMVIDMNEARISTVGQMRQVLAGTQELGFKASADEAGRYEWISAVLKRIGYRHLKRTDRGTVLEYVRHLSGYSRAQVTRLVKRAMRGEKLVKRYRKPAHAFARRYTAADAVLLAEVDQAMNTLSGPATARVLQRMRDDHGDQRFERLGSISSGQVYNLRHSAAYQEKLPGQQIAYTHTQPVRAATIGVRRAPAPDGKPGFIRIDSVHQGDLDGVKGLYHINAVDCVTQWQVVSSVEGISEAFLLPVIEQMLAQFPFTLHGFHADNGSEYVNHRVAELLNKLHVEFTRSRPRHSNDNGLVETKNGVVIRKLFGYEHIPQHFAARFNAVCQEHLNPFLNFHRPCLFATELPDPKKPGRIKRVYRAKDAMTPFEKLLSLPDAAGFLRPGVTLEGLHAQACARTALEAGAALHKARDALCKPAPRRRRAA
jgi:hypothetical protein